MIAEEHRLAGLDTHLVGVLLAAHGRDRKPVADIDAVHCVDAHQALGEVGIELVVDRIAQTDGNARRHDLDDRAARRATLAHIVEIALPGLAGLAVGTPEGIVAGGVPIPFAAVDFLGAELDHGATYLYAVAQDFARDRAGRDAHCGLARRRAAPAAIVAHAVFLEVGVVGMGRPELVLDLGIVAAALVDVVDMEPDPRAGRGAPAPAPQDP